MRILVAPDSFKGSLTAQRFCAVAQSVLQTIDPRMLVDLCPMADGGEGTAAAVVGACGGYMTEHEVEGPLGAPTRASIGWTPDGATAIIDLASASGLTLTPPAQRQATAASTFGTGQLVALALTAGAQRIVLGLGGSAATDGGAGLLEALGCRFFAASGAGVARGGAGLAELRRIDASGLDPRLAQVQLDVACDVDNPLLGSYGASHVYGPQKGATPSDAASLDAALTVFADVVAGYCGRDYRSIPGAGAAGGAGFGLMSLLSASMQPGFDMIAELTGLTTRLRTQRYDWLITGEGCIDAQSRSGKLLSRLGLLAMDTQTPTIAFTGSLQLATVDALTGIDYIFPITQGPCTLQEAVERCEELLASTLDRVMRLALRGSER